MHDLATSQRRNFLTKSETVVAYLQQMALPSMWQRILSESDYELWDTVLEPYSLPAIKFAFDTWIGGARKFPNPADILPLCGSFAEQQALKQHYMVAKSADHKGALSPEVTMGLIHEIIARAETHYSQGVKNPPPIEEREIETLIEKARIRSQCSESGIARFPNGNPKYNRALTQARALLTLPPWRHDAIPF